MPAAKIDSMAHDLTQVTSSTRRNRSGAAHASGNDRQRAFAQARRHSAWVRVLKLVLPLSAVVATAGLFLSPTMLLRLARPDLNGSIAGVEITTDQLRMTHPRFDGFTADQGHYVITAAAAVQMLDNTDLMQLESVHGHLDQPDKSWTDLTSKGGSYQTKTKALRLTDGIVMTTSVLARAELDHADVDVDRKLVTSDAAVTMTMPNGTVKGRGLLVDNQARRVLLRTAVTAHLLAPARASAPPTQIPASEPALLVVAPAMSDAPVDITSRQLEILDNAKTATFTGSVQAVQAGMTLRSERMEVGYAGSPGPTPATPSNSTPSNTGPSAQNLSYVANSEHVVLSLIHI